VDQRQQQHDFNSFSSLKKRKESRAATTGDPILTRTTAPDGVLSCLLETISNQHQPEANHNTTTTTIIAGNGSLQQHKP
jgi:hypothetical protein